MLSKRLQSVPLQSVHFCDPFFSRYLNVVRDVTLPYQWQAINDQVDGAAPSHCLENFRIAAKLSDRPHVGPAYQDTDLAKWLEAASYSLASNPDPELERMTDEVIDLIAAAQCPDGYLNTYYTVNAPDQRWSDLREGHELYTAGHMIEAGVAYYEATGKRRFLDMVCRFADLIHQTFGPEEGKLHGYPGHQEIELALFRLYQVTGDKRYSDLAKYFLDARGASRSYFAAEQARPVSFDRACYQDHLPVREQFTAEGHAVRAVYMYCAMADIADAYQDRGLMTACEKIWANLTQKRMYITGSIGSSGPWERFTTDYDLPNDNGCWESCASIGLALFAKRMAQIHRDASYMDTAELALYNTVLAGIALDGTHFFYNNPLEIWPDSVMGYTAKGHIKHTRQPWFGLACCPPNIARTLTNLGAYAMFSGDDTVYINLYTGCQAGLSLPQGKILLRIDSHFPFHGSVRITAESSCRNWKLALRLPGYVKEFSLKQNGVLLSDIPQEGHYLILEGVSGTQNFELDMALPIRYVRANPLVRADSGKVAVMKGPLVYCLEEADNGGNLAACYLDTAKAPKEVYNDNLLEGCLTLQLSGMQIDDTIWRDDTLYSDRPITFRTKELTAIPYCFWNNRGPGEMQIWIKELPR